jgi:hypothetical protein
MTIASAGGSASTTNAAGRPDEQERIEQAAQPWVEPLARLGLAARGLVYAVVGILAVRVALEKPEEADRRGALEAVGRQPFGKVLLVVMAVGFGGYALWRYMQALLDTENDGADAKGLAKRGGYLARAVLYSAFCVSTVRFLMGSGAPSGGAEQQQNWTARLLEQPFGPFLVVVVGLAVIGVGLRSGYRGVTGKYRKRLKTGEMDRVTDKWVDEVAATGLLGRMAGFVLVGFFLIKAALDYDASEAAGLDGALKRIGQTGWGDFLIVLVGAGLFAYGAYSCVEARYRRVLED